MALPPIVRFLALCAFAAATLSAQEEDVSRFDFLNRENSEWVVPKNTVTFGFRILMNGPSVKFGNLGTVPSSREIAPLSDGAVTRTYDNGSVGVDAPRADEVDADGNQTSTPGSRYQTTVYNNDGTKVDNGDGTTTDAGDGTYTTVADSLAYTPGLTRSWSYQSASQVNGSGMIGMSTYSATSEGGVAAHDQKTSAGVELQLARMLGKISKRVEWSLVAGVALSDINNKAGGTVTSTLHTHTDFYSLNGQPAPEAPYAGPSYTDLLDADGNVVTTGGYETTTPLNALPSSSSDTTAVGGASVQGNWQIKGAYFLLRLGPSIRTQITDHLGLSASVGVAGAYTGSTYSVVETIDLPDVTSPVTTVEQSSDTRLLPGYYADLNMDWMLTDRTGFFGGVTMQRFGDYDQAVGGRTARIDIGSSFGLRGGMSIRF